jgi:hypothetical protein
MICTVYSDKIKQDEVGGTKHTWEVCVQNFGWETRREQATWKTRCRQNIQMNIGFSWILLLGKITLILNNSHWLQLLMSLSHSTEMLIFKQGCPHIHYYEMFIVPTCDWLAVVLVVQSCEVQKAAFECQWYKHSKVMKHFLLMIIARSQKAVYLSGCQFYVVSLQTFGKVQYLRFRTTV